MLRNLAALLDSLLILVLTGVLASTTGRFFAERAVVTFRIYSPDTLWNGPLPLVLGAFSTVTYGLAFAAVAIFVSEGLWGASPGKLICRRQVAGSRKALRCLLKTAPAWLFCSGLLVGRWELTAVAALVAAWSVVDLLTMAWHRDGPWYDRLLGTRVVASA